MAEASSESAVGKFIGAPISAALTALGTWLTAGANGAVSQAMASLLAFVGGICALALTLYYRRQLAVLGANRRVPAERQAYDALRNSLAEGNMAARLYARRLTAFLDAVDRFFEDAGKADHTLFPHAFGLKMPGTTMDRSGFRTLPSARLDLPNRDDLYHLGDFRPRRSCQIRSASGHRSCGLAEVACRRVGPAFWLYIMGCHWKGRVEAGHSDQRFHRLVRCRHGPFCCWCSGYDHRRRSPARLGWLF